MSQPGASREGREIHQDDRSRDQGRVRLYVVKKIAGKELETQEAPAPETRQNPRNFRRYGKYTLYL
jgi:hypothetical protein